MRDRANPHSRRLGEDRQPFRLLLRQSVRRIRDEEPLLSAAAVLAASWPLAGAGAQDDAPTISVRVADLDLGTGEGRAAFHRRVADAARGACRELAVGSPFDWTEVTQCERRMLAKARERTALAAAAAQRRARLAAVAAER